MLHNLLNTIAYECETFTLDQTGFGKSTLLFIKGPNQNYEFIPVFVKHETFRLQSFELNLVKLTEQSRKL